MSSSNSLIKNKWLNLKPFAHRGLHSDSIPENSMKSFIEAEKKGFNIELDVRITKDNELIVLHDKFINSLNIEKTNYKNLPKIKNEKIEKLETILDYFKNKQTKILIELKPTKKREILQNKTLELVEDMNNIAIISFDPRIVSFFSGKKVIGLSFDENKYIKYRIDILILLKAIKPDFLILHKSIIKNKEISKLRIPKIYWTITNKKEKEELIYYIFDKF